MVAVVILPGATEQARCAGAYGYVTKRDDYLARLPSALRAAVKRLHSAA